MPDIGDIYRVLAKGRILSAVETRNMFSYVLTSANATETEVAVGLETHIEQMFDTLKGHLSNAWALYETETQKWHPAAGGNPGYWLGYHSHSHTAQGQSVSDLSGYQPAILMIFKTAAKKVLGRKFLAGVAEEYTTAGSLTAAVLTALATDLANILASVTFGAGGVAEPGVLDKSGVFHEFLSGTVGSIISSMRRRKPGYGI